MLTVCFEPKSQDYIIINLFETACKTVVKSTSNSYDCQINVHISWYQTILKFLSFIETLEQFFVMFLSRLGMDDLDSDEDDDVLVTSRDESKDIPALSTSTATSSTSTHAESSTPYNEFENRHCMETRKEEIVGENELEGETKGQTKDFQEKDSDSPPQTTNQEGGLREDSVGEKDQVTDIQPAEKVSEVKV